MLTVSLAQRVVVRLHGESSSRQAVRAAKGGGAGGRRAKAGEGRRREGGREEEEEGEEGGGKRSRARRWGLGLGGLGVGPDSVVSVAGMANLTS